MLMPSLLLVLAITILSQAGNIIRFADASPLVVAFLRLSLALGILLPWSIGALRKGFPAAKGRPFGVLAAMGVMFALHFVAWIAAVQSTTVANAAICFSMSPLFTAVGARIFLKEVLPKRIFVTIALGVMGIGFVGFSDLSLEPRHLWGDALGLVSGLCFSVYLLIGKTLRQSFENRFVMCTVYTCGALALLPLVAAKPMAFAAITPQTWMALCVLALFPTILGHATMIYLMRFFRASTLSLATLVEPVLAGLVAWLVFHEPMSPLVLVGYALIVLGLLIPFVDLPRRRRSQATEA